MRRHSDCQHQYDGLAEHWDRCMSSPAMRQFALCGDSICGVENALTMVGPAATVLDCACGSGLLVLDLLERGYAAYGSDGSAEMIRIARRRASKEQLTGLFCVSRWRDLETKWRRRFDLVICSGGSLDSCRGEDDMIAALRGMHAVLKPGGLLFVDAQDWEAMRESRAPYSFGPAVPTQDGRIVWLLRTQYARIFHQRHLLEIIIMYERSTGSTVYSFPISVYPFGPSDLKHRLEVAGFTELQTSFRKGSAPYGVIASKALERQPQSEQKEL